MIMRPKNRYLLVESSAPLDTRDRILAKQILDAVAFEIGAIGYVKSNPKIVYQAGDRAFILRINRGYEDGVVLALSFVKEIGNVGVGFYTIKTSGTILALTSYFKRHYPDGQVASTNHTNR